MKALLWIGGIFLVLLLLVVGSFNGMATGRNAVNASFGVYHSQLQRRADLIPNLVATVRGYAEHEERVFTEVTEARARASQLLQLDPNQLASSPELQRQLLDAQNTLSGALSRLMVVVEAYPQLQSSERFGQLQAQLEGTENRIAVARRDTQLAIQTYNNRIQTLPGVLFAGMFGFEPFAFYEATAPNAEQAPTVDFSTTP